MEHDHEQAQHQCMCLLFTTLSYCDDHGHPCKLKKQHYYWAHTGTHSHLHVPSLVTQSTDWPQIVGLIKHVDSLSVLSGFCRTPYSLLNGQRTYTSTTVGSRVTYTCNTGYRLTAGSSSRTCQSYGLWSGSHPTCTSKSSSLQRVP